MLSVGDGIIVKYDNCVPDKELHIVRLIDNNIVWIDSTTRVSAFSSYILMKYVHFSIEDSSYYIKVNDLFKLS